MQVEVDVTGLYLTEQTDQVWQGWPSRHTDHAATMSNSRRATPLSSASNPGVCGAPWNH